VKKLPDNCAAHQTAFAEISPRFPAHRQNANQTAGTAFVWQSDMNTVDTAFRKAVGSFTLDPGARRNFLKQMRPPRFCVSKSK
jgi:hypothetical protein